MQLTIPLNPLSQSLPGAHGPLMIAGFLSTLISLERAAAMRARWSYAAPFFSALGAIALIVGLPFEIGKTLIVLGSVGMIAIFAVIIRHQRTLFTVTMGLGAVALFVGNFLWLMGWGIYEIVGWWAGFLILTIAGERLELSRVTRRPPIVNLIFLIACSMLLIGLIGSTVVPTIGLGLSGLGILGLSLWLLRYDLARRTVRSDQPSLTRFIAVCMLSGYVWLTLGGLLWLFGGGPAGLNYDAGLHTIFLGFVFSMIFGHAPIIFPAVLGRSMQFTSRFYLHLALLHLSLVLRIVGDFSGSLTLRQWGGVLNEVAILLFLANTVWAIRASAKAQSLVR